MELKVSLDMHLFPILHSPLGEYRTFMCVLVLCPILAMIVISAAEEVNPAEEKEISALVKTFTEGAESAGSTVTEFF